MNVVKHTVTFICLLMFVAVFLFFFGTLTGVGHNG